MPLTDAEVRRKAKLLLPILRAMAAIAVLAFVGSLFDSRNKPVVSFGFYGAAMVVVLGLGVIVRRGYVVAAAWTLSLFFWALIAGAMFFFGGMQGHNAAIFTVSIMIVGTLVGSRSALVLALASLAWCGLIVVLEMKQLLPVPMVPYSPINSWIALSATVILTTVLLHGTLASLRESHQRAEASARERDEALRRSISAQKMELVGNLSSGIAHDFNNLLAVIGSTGSHLREALPPDDQELVEVLDDLDAATQRATLITRQLLSLGQGHEGAPTAVDLGLLVRSLGSMLPRLLGTKTLVVCELSDGVVVSASRVGLEQVLLNLAVNARDAMPDGGTLSLRVRRDGEMGVLTVSDTGVGMDAATKAHAFDAFFTTKATGTGLGLATVRAVMARYRGTLEVESTPGHGTTFELRLGLSVDAAVAPPADPKALSTTMRTRALVVEDDLLVRRTTTRVLERAGYEVIAVNNGLEALGLLERVSDFQVVVTDIVMPRLDGDELARRLTTLYPEMPVVLYSGNRAPSEDVLASPRRAFVRKPSDSVTLLAAIAEATRQG